MCVCVCVGGGGGVVVVCVFCVFFFKLAGVFFSVYQIQFLVLRGLRPSSPYSI